MLGAERFRGHPQMMVIQLHTFNVICSRRQNAVFEGRLLIFLLHCFFLSLAS